MVNDKSVNDVIKSYRLKYKPMSLQEEHALIRMAQAGNRKALGRLIENNGLFAIKVAVKFRKYNAPFEHITQCALLGLRRSILSFDTSRGLRLISHAVWWVRAYVKREIQDTATIIKLPANWHWEKQMRPMMESVRGAFSIDCPVNLKDKDGSMHDILPSEFDDPCQEIDSQKIMDELFGAAKLNDRERDIVERNYGIIDGRKISLTDIGIAEGISHERVRQIRDVALDKCRDRIKRRRLEKLGVENYWNPGKKAKVV